VKRMAVGPGEAEATAEDEGIHLEEVGALSKEALRRTGRLGSRGEDGGVGEGGVELSEVVESKLGRRQRP